MIRTAVLACGVLAALVLAIGATASAKPAYAWKAKGTSCFAAPKGDRAQSRWWMAVGPSYAVSKVGVVTASVRFVPHGSSFNLGRSWTRASKSVVQNTWYTFALNLPVPDTLKDWDLQVDLKWDRTSAVDHHQKFMVPFDESKCPDDGSGDGSGDGGGLTPASTPALSNAGTSLPAPAKALVNSGG